MTWTATTITSPDTTSIQVLPENLVVFSENDMWLVAWNDAAGYSSSDLWTAGYSGDKIFLGHYNGLHWTRDLYISPE